MEAGLFLSMKNQQGTSIRAERFKKLIFRPSKIKKINLKPYP